MDGDLEQKVVRMVLMVIPQDADRPGYDHWGHPLPPPPPPQPVYDPGPPPLPTDGGGGGGGNSWGGCGCLLALLVLGVIYFGNQHPNRQPPPPPPPDHTVTFGTSYVQTDANVRSGPGKEHQSLAVATKGTLVTLLSDPDKGQPRWIKVRVSGGETGYIHRSLLSATPPPQPAPLSGDLIGSWRGSVVYDGKPVDWVYTFNSDGTFEDRGLDDQGQVVSGGNGTYTLDDGKIVINWPSGTEEKASIAWTNADEFQYAITSHSDEKQVGLRVVFHRSGPVSDIPAPVNPGLSEAEQAALQQQQDQMRQQQQQEQSRAADEEHYQREESGDLQPPRY